MKKILLMVTSVDGKTTKGDDKNTHSWTSKEDQNYFFKEIEKTTALIMGRATLEAAEHLMQHRPGKIRVIMTRSPEKYRLKEIPEQLEFTNSSPLEIVTRLEEQGHKKVLLVGGEDTSTLFLKERLIDEIYLTVEPKIFGIGNSMFKRQNLDVTLRLKSIKQLNPQGTLLLKYKVTSPLAM